MATNTGNVDYSKLDPAKVDAQELGAESDNFVKTRGVKRYNERGETFAAFELPDGHGFNVQVHETLGTKNMLGEWPWICYGDTYGFFNSSVSAIGAIANDFAVSGVRPINMQMHFAVGNEAWFAEKARLNAFHLGWLEGCKRSGASWMGGDTPALAQVSAEHPVLDGSAMGWTPAHIPPLRPTIAVGDVMLGILCTGPQENGYSGIRRLVTKIPRNIREEFVRLALEPSVICVEAVMALRERGIDPSYCVPISGHGFSKIQRSKQRFTYVVDKVPPQPHVFQWIQEYGKFNPYDMYYSYNNGLCFVIMVRPESEQIALQLLGEAGYFAMRIGQVEDGEQKVVVSGIGEYGPECLKI